MQQKPIKPYIDKFVNIKHSDNMTIRLMPKYKHKGILQYTQVHSNFIEGALHLHTLASVKVLLALISVNGSIVSTASKVHMSQKQLASMVGIYQPEVSVALKLLKEHNLIVNYSRGFIELNPEYVWKGNLNLREGRIQELKDQTEQECTN